MQHNPSNPNKQNRQILRSQNNENRIVAALDVGSNSVRLLVARACGGVFMPVFTDRISSRLYENAQDGWLDSASIARTKRAIRQLSEAAREHGAQAVWGFGTSAMRDGRNSHELIEDAARHGVELEILSGFQEAEICYRGAAPEGEAGIIDIGGGSTELVAGEHGVPMALGSAQMGAVRLKGMLDGVEDKRKMREQALIALLPAWERVKDRYVERFIGLGGTITTLAAIQLGLKAYDPIAIENERITAHMTGRMLDHIVSLDMDARKRIPGMDAARADILPYGLAILCAFFELSGAEAVYACDRDNLVGYLMKKMG